MQSSVRQHQKPDNRTIVEKWRGTSPLIKVAVSWGFWATVCLTGYYFARKWAGEKRVESLKIRQTMNENFSLQLEEARLKMEEKEAKAAPKK